MLPGNFPGPARLGLLCDCQKHRLRDGYGSPVIHSRCTCERRDNDEFPSRRGRFRNAADDLQRKGQHLERLKLERLAETIRRGFLRGSAQRGNISNGVGRAMGLSGQRTKSSGGGRIEDRMIGPKTGAQEESDSPL